MNRNRLYLVIAATLFAGSALAQSADPQSADAKAPPARSSVSTTSNTTTSNDTQRAQQLQAVTVSAHAATMASGLMSVQTAPKAVSTISREAIVKASPGANFTQLIQSIPGVNSSTDDVTGLNDGNYSIRGFTGDEIGASVNGAPINDSGSYKVYATEYGDSENMGDITVLQGIPDVDMPDSGAAGGHIAWTTIDPTHTAGVDFVQSAGSNNYRRTFFRLNTGDLGPTRSWISWSDNSDDKWRGKGKAKVNKVDAKTVWTIDDNNSITGSLQYNREVKYLYLGPTKAAVAQHGYHYDYDESYKPGSLDTNYWQLHANPFSSLMASADGEFTFSDSLHLSVVPYFQYGDGGSGTGNSFFAESTSTKPSFESANQDLNQDGAIVTGPNGKKALAYGFSSSTTYRPGVIAKFNQDLSDTNALEYGVWYERTRQEQGETFSLADYNTGAPINKWGDSDFIVYPNGEAQKQYDEFTLTETKKAFATDTWTPNDYWTFTAGASYMHVERSGFAYEFPGSFFNSSPKFSQIGSDGLDYNFHKFLPTAGIKFAPDANSQIFYGIGKTFRVPPNTAVFLNTVTGRNANKPESAWNNDLGYRYYTDDFAGSVMLYRSNFNNKQESGYDQNTGETFYTEIAKVKMQGVDGEATWRFADHWSLYGSYTYTQSKIESNLDTGDDGIFPLKGKDLYNTPRNLGYAALSYDDSSFWATLSAKSHSSFYGDYMNTEKAGGYTTLGLAAGFRFADFETWFRKPYIKINLDNLTDHKAFTNASNSTSFLASNPGKEIDVNGKVLFASAPYYSLLEPRTIMVTVGASFF